MERILMPKDIPKSLWDGNNVLKLPIPLAKGYIETLVAKGLLGEAFNVSPKG